MIGTSHISARPSDVSRPAVFLDRDGTITEYRGYITVPGQLELISDAAKTVRQLTADGFVCVLVTNQSAIGRGMVVEDELTLIHDRLLHLLSTEGASLGAIYYCPEAPDGEDELGSASDDRKPGPGMLQRAAADLNLDLGASWMIGDRFSDVLAGQRAGCKGSIRVRTGHQYAGEEPKIATQFYTVNSLQDASSFVLNGEAACLE